MNHPDHIHTIDTYPHVRQVFVNGKEVKNAFYADTVKGLVRYYDDPAKMHKHGKRAITRTIRGDVTVVLK